MKFPQFYESTILLTHEVVLHVISIPARSFPIDEPFNELFIEFENDTVKGNALGGALLGYQVIAPVSKENVPSALALSLLPASELQKQTDQGILHNINVSSVADLALLAMSESFVPIEFSPLGANSISTFLQNASSTAVGAYAGYLLAGPTPLLLLTVPAGMILVGAASGVAKGLEEGLRRKLINVISGEKDPDE